MIRLVAIVVLLAGCAKKSEEPPPPGPAPMKLSPTEITRGQDACRVLVERACACAQTVAAAKQACADARALPEAMKMSLSVAASPDSERDDALRAQTAVRETAKECIEQTAKLAALGCPDAPR
ncbi:MAG TPA: hypothetical protein VLX92_12040 [Kofleriaceae bacterium]|nr:hypothetical protein [Kofleriaceae bacterium]